MLPNSIIAGAHGVWKATLHRLFHYPSTQPATRQRLVDLMREEIPAPGAPVGIPVRGGLRTARNVQRR